MSGTDPSGRDAGLWIRQAAPGDIPAIKRVIFDALTTYGLQPEPEGTDADLDHIDEVYRDGLFEVLVDADGNIVGTVGLAPADEPGAVELRKMYFAPAVRGKGWGSTLLARMIEKARAMGFRSMVLETASPLREAIILYRRFGFRERVGEPCVARCDQAFELELSAWQGPPRPVRCLQEVEND
ncbi:MAG: GNAT family N-acetyltransferase [Gammaproteobacteria bacterium]|jgi:putative acetyltransferase